MDRRQFFRKGIGKVANVVLSAAEERVLHKAQYWLRPPFAIGELDFLLKCTRCSACIDACPHQVIFPLPMARGGDVAGTPALDLLNKGCHLCSDWPCVNACETGALSVVAQAPSGDEAESALQSPVALEPDFKLSEVRIDSTRCLPYLGPECGACQGSCPVSALIWQDNKPSIDPNRCVGCALCREACITDPKAVSVTKASSLTNGGSSPTAAET